MNKDNIFMTMYEKRYDVRYFTVENVIKLAKQRTKGNGSGEVLKTLENDFDDFENDMKSKNADNINNSEFRKLFSLYCTSCGYVLGSSAKRGYGMNKENVFWKLYEHINEPDYTTPRKVIELAKERTKDKTPDQILKIIDNDYDELDRYITTGNAEFSDNGQVYQFLTSFYFLSVGFLNGFKAGKENIEL